MFIHTPEKLLKSIVIDPTFKEGQISSNFYNLSVLKSIISIFLKEG